MMVARGGPAAWGLLVPASLAPELGSGARPLRHIMCVSWPAGDQPGGRSGITLPSPKARVTTDSAAPPWTGWKVEVGETGGSAGTG